jgi:hypothetical protein
MEGVGIQRPAPPASFGDLVTPVEIGTPLATGQYNYDILNLQHSTRPKGMPNEEKAN